MPENKRFLDLLAAEYKKETLLELLDNPDYKHTIKEIADETSGSYNSVKNFLEDLNEFGIIEFQKKGNLRLVRYKASNKYHEIIKSLFSAELKKFKQIANEYASKIYSKKNLRDKIISIGLFGSVARNSADKDSDVDILILVKENEFVEEVKKISRRKASKFTNDTEIVPVIETLEEFKKNLENDKRFEKNVKRDYVRLEGDDLNEKI